MRLLCIILALLTLSVFSLNAQLRLDVDGDARITGDLNLTSGSIIMDGSGANIRHKGTLELIANYNSLGTEHIAFRVGGIGLASEYMRIASNGNVGIRNTTPKFQLHVGNGNQTPVNFAQYRMVLANGANGQRAAILSMANTSTGAKVEAELEADGQGLSGEPSVVVGAATNHRLLLRTNNLNRMIITPDGDIGVGITAPPRRFSVEGDVFFDDVVYVEDAYDPTGNNNGSVIATFFGGGPAYGGDGTFTFNPGTGAEDNGFILESKGRDSGTDKGESGGYYADGDMAAVWSPGDINLFEVHDEDLMYNSTSLKWYINGGGVPSSGSDIRFKTDIAPIEDALKKVLQLRGVSYDWIQTADEKEKGTLKPRSLGVISQELEEVIPELVETNNGYKYVQYTGLIPVLIEAMKEQQSVIEEKDEKIEALETRLALMENLMEEKFTRIEASLQQCCLSYDQSLQQPGNDGAVIPEGAYLEQNRPNPFNQQTIIRYYLPATTQNAQLHIRDLSGKLLETFELDDSGLSTITIDGNTLAPGTFFYTLVVDGQIVDTKRMVLTR